MFDESHQCLPFRGYSITENLESAFFEPPGSLLAWNYKLEGFNMKLDELGSRRIVTILSSAIFKVSMHFVF